MNKTTVFYQKNERFDFVCQGGVPSIAHLKDRKNACHNMHSRSLSLKTR